MVRSKLLVVMLIVSGFFFQGTVAAESVLDKAVKYYQASHYDSTIAVIRAYLKVQGKAPETEQLVPLMVEALARKGDNATIHRLHAMYIQKFPKSKFVPRLWYIEGVTLAKDKEYLQAVNAFTRSLDGGVSAELDSLTISAVELICNENLTLDQLGELSEQEMHPRIHEIARYAEIQKTAELGQAAKAKTLRDQFRTLYPRSKYTTELDKVYSQLETPKSDNISVGFLAPLSGENAEVGKKVYQGVQLAVQEYRGNSHINLIALDTKGNLLEAAKKTRELRAVHNVPVVIGPILTHTATVSAAMLSQDSNVVMITPTANEDGIALLGNNIFQMNIPLASLAKSIARYAIENLNIREFAIVAPRTSYGYVMAENFREELRLNNIEPVAEEFFEEGTNDFTQLFSSLRASLLKRKLETIAFEKRGVSKGVRVTREDSLKWADSTLNVGGLFIPADAEDLLMLTPQVRFNRIVTQMLGSNGWHDRKLISGANRYVANAFISSVFETDPNQKEWLSFRDAYKAKFGQEPDKPAILGYDAAKCVLKVISRDAQSIREGLLGIKKYQGLSGMISFDQNGINTESIIYKITDTDFLRVK